MKWDEWDWDDLDDILYKLDSHKKMRKPKDNSSVTLY